VTLKGRGFTYRWADVDNVVFDSPAGVTQIGPFNDKISSLQWVRQS
jgi:hypothetical protein